MSSITVLNSKTKVVGSFARLTMMIIHFLRNCESFVTVDLSSTFDLRAQLRRLPETVREQRLDAVECPPVVVVKGDGLSKL